MEITKMMVLGTVHLTPETARSWMPQCSWACFEKADYGWIMYVCDDQGIIDASEVPLEIRSALHVARREGCGWIMWDCDGPVIDELPQYDWSVAVPEYG